jgi:hemerythrin HHE cation binding domain-containing protein
MPTRTEEVASEAMGALKAAKSTFEGLHGVFKKLAEEHGKVSALLMRVKLASDVNVRRRLFPEIRAQLLAHERGELREVYPVFANHAELAPRALRHAEEAAELEQLLDRLSTADFAALSWKEMFDTLVDRVSRHAREEENDYFPAAEKLLGKEEAERLERRYEATKAEVLRQSA